MKKMDLTKGPIQWMARNNVAANLVMIILIVCGLIMGYTMKKEVFPKADLDMITVTVPYPGASPAEIESGIILAIEEAVRSLDGIKEIKASANEGVGVVQVELETGTNKSKALSDVKNAVDRITSFPEEIETPIVSLPEIKSETISVAVYADLTEVALRELAEDVRQQLLDLPEVTYVDMEGVRDLEIAIEIPEDNLRAHHITLNQVAAVVGSMAIEVPGGGVRTSEGEVLLRTNERRHDADEFRNIPVVVGQDGSIVRLGDIATIRDSFAETDNFATYNGKPAILLKVFSVADQSPTDVAIAVKNFTAKLQSKMPEGVGITTWKDMSQLFTDRVDLLLRNAMLGLILVLGTLGLFLDPKLAFWVTMGIPISFFGSLIFLPPMGISLNMISMFAFIITLGMVVDDAIVVGENTYRYRQEGMSRLEAAIKGAKEMAVPVFFSISTTIAAFAPLLWLPGTRGKFAYAVPVVVLLVLGISLVESFFVLPSHLGHLKEKKNGQSTNALMRVQQRISTSLEYFVLNFYKPFLEKAIKYKGVTIASCIALLFITFGLVAGGRIKVIDMPNEESDTVNAEVVMPYGVAVEETMGVTNRLVSAAQKTLAEYGDQYSLGIYSRVGSGAAAVSPMRKVQSGSNITGVSVILVPTDQRPFSSMQFANKWRENLGPVLNADTMSFDTSIHGSTKPIDLELSHNDTDALEAAARDLATNLSGYSGVFDVDNGVQLGKPQMDFTVSDAGINAGLTSADIAMQVRAAFYGAEALRQQKGRNEVKIMVRLPLAERQKLNTIEDLVIRTRMGAEIPFKDAATINYGRAYTSINRTDGRRTINVQADVKEGEANPDEIVSALRKDVIPKLKAKYPGLDFSLGGRQGNMQEFLDYLKLGFSLALIAIFGLLAIPLRSYLQPILVVMISIPFGLIGAVFGHLIMGMNLSMFSIMGLVALAGVVVNGAIVLVDAANNQRLSGQSIFDAAVKASVIRFRPVLLTTLTTFFGLTPMIFETSVQARVITPMAVSLGFGILFSMFFILVLVPTLWYVVEHIRDAWRGEGIGEQAATQE